MSKLDEIKVKYEDAEGRFGYIKILTESDYLWLIEQAEKAEQQQKDIKEWERISDVKDSHLVRNGKEMMKLIDEKAMLESEIERLKEDCAHWKMKWRDSVSLDEDES